MLEIGEGKQPRRVLVTGASGFLGAPCVELLAERGFEVHALSRRGAGDGPGHWWRADLLGDSDRVEGILGRVRPSHLLHLAWATGHEGFRDGLENYRWIGASLELLRLFAQGGGRRVVVAGSGAEYDWSGGRCHEESTPLDPSSTYGLCKHTFSRLAGRYAEQKGLDLSWARLFFLFGPGEDDYRLMAAAIRSLLARQPAECTFDLLERDYLFVLDAARGLVDLLDSEVTGAVNLAAGEAVELGHLVRRAAARAGRPELVRLGGEPAGAHPAPLVVADIERARRELGWQPRWTLDDALDHTLGWWRRRLDA